MTFDEERIKNIAVAMDDEWQYLDDDIGLSVMFYGLEDYPERFWQREERYPDGWVDCYAEILIDGSNKAYVRKIEFVLITNDSDNHEFCLSIIIADKKESRLLADKLFETSDGGLQQMIDDIERR